MGGECVCVCVGGGGGGGREIGISQLSWSFLSDENGVSHNNNKIKNKK